MAVNSLISEFDSVATLDVREMKVLAATMSAQYGRMNGGVFQYTTKLWPAPVFLIHFES
jgi:hypothetical protein